MADWDDEEFEPATAAADAATGAPKTDKWEGEDEEDDVRDAWDVSSDDEDSQKSKDGEPVVQKKKKKKLADIIAEKEEARAKKMAEDAYETEEKLLNDTPEARLAEKLRQQKMAEDGDFELARELLGTKDSTPVSQEGTLDAMSPVSKDEFEEFQKAISEKIASFENSEHYPEFVENLVKSMCMTLSTITLKKIKTDVEAFHSAKLKEDKAAKAGKKPPNTKRNVIKMERDNDFGGGGGFQDNDMDDFM